MKTYVTNAEVIAKESMYMAKGQKIPYSPIAFCKGKGAILTDCDGKEYIDFLSSASSQNIGFGNEEIADAVREQMARMPQYTSVYFANHETVELAERLSKLAGEGMKVVFSTTGSESIDGAIKIARSFTGRPTIISFFESYHGSSFGALSISAISGNMRRRIGPLMPSVEHFHYPTCIRCHYGKGGGMGDGQVSGTVATSATCGMLCIKELENAFATYLPSDEVAAIFFEPIAGDAGLVVPPMDFVQRLRELCDKHGILLVSDEIQQGMGRSGKWFGLDHFGVKADLYVLGKSVGGGLPLGVVIGRAEVIDSMNSPAHVFSMTGNATVSAAALKMLDIYERDGLLDGAIQKGAYLKARLEGLKSRFDIIGDVRGLGLSLAVDLVKDRNTMEKNYDAAVRISYRCIRNGLILVFFGQSALRIQPPLVVTEDEMERALAILEEALDAYVAGEIGEEAFEYMKGW